MDCIRQCYYSSMRLYPDRPDILTRGRWHWCPPGAQAVPFLHRFGSHNFQDPEQPGDPPIGETQAYGGYSAGRANPRYTGLHFCGPQELWQQGSPVALRGTPPVQRDGVPVCCLAPGQPLGGALCNGHSTFTNSGTVLFWERPEELVDVPFNTLISVWPAAPGSQAEWQVPGGALSPTRLEDPDRGLPLVFFGQVLLPHPGRAPEMRTVPVLPALHQLALYLVSYQSSVNHRLGPLLLGPTRHAIGVFGVGRDQILLATTTNAGTVSYIGTEGQLHLYAARLSPMVSEVWVDARPIAGGDGGGGGTLRLDGISTTTLSSANQGRALVFEVLLFGRYLSDAENRALFDNYLVPKYFGTTGPVLVSHGPALGGGSSGMSPSPTLASHGGALGGGHGVFVLAVLMDSGGGALGGGSSAFIAGPGLHSGGGALGGGHGVFVLAVLMDSGGGALGGGSSAFIGGPTLFSGGGALGGGHGAMVLAVLMDSGGGALGDGSSGMG